MVHHNMSPAELKRYFGTSSVSEVRDYEVTHPFLSNENGEFVSYELSQQHLRLRRSTDKSSEVYYHVKAFGLDLRLNVSSNENLLGPKFVIEVRHSNGSTTTTTPDHVDHFIGNVISHPESTVAISSGAGLEGMIKLMDDTFFVHPLPSHLSQRHKRSFSSAPHIIVKKSAKAEVAKCDENDKKTEHSRVQRSTVESQGELNETLSHKYVQTLYVVDQYILNFLGESTLTSILPVLANIVAGIFRDASFGEIKVNYVLNKIVFLNNGELTYHANASSTTKVDQIRSWARENNPESGDPEHFDTVTLISLGDLGGRGVLGTICTGDPSTANLANIAGINSAGTIAHEVFHNFGYLHDGTEECPDLKYIMATTVSPGPASFTWSKCSREFAQSFLRSGASSCFDDPPSQAIEKPTVSPEVISKLPGVTYDADRQCELRSGASYRKCPTMQNQCGSLYCTNDGQTCNTLFTPPLDGTRCGVRHWCIKGVCVDDGSPIIDGQWGEWSEYGACTRTCGGGVQSKTRNCDNPSPQNGGRNCEGGSRGQYRACNTQACPERSVSFRQQQCSAKGEYTEHIATDDRCSLLCSSDSVVYWLGTVTDGTRCYRDKNTLDVCVEAHCKEVGCDHGLQSGKRLDRCRVCDGDGSSCGLRIFNYTKIYHGYGFANADTMVTLPVQSSNVVAVQKSVTYNMIDRQTNADNKTAIRTLPPSRGVQSIEGEYLINLPTWSTSVNAAGTTISYIHEDNMYQDRIYIPGPTNQEIKLVFVYLYEDNQGVDISYYSPAEGTNQTAEFEFEWQVSSWSACSRSCAGGLKTRLRKCLRSDDKTEVGYDNCDQSIKPDIVSACNIQACPPEWYTTPWQSCSLTCGKGSQQRKVVCRQKLAENEWKSLVDETYCVDTKPEVSPLVRNCNEIHCPPEYAGKEWSECSTTCSPGVITRELQCERRTALGNTEILPEHWCQDYHSVKPPTIENCNMDSPCEPPPHLEIGCFELDLTIFPSVLANFQETLNYDDVLATVRACAKLAFHNNYSYFGLANDGECRVGPDLESNFFKPRTTDQCNSFVGKTNAIYVYTLNKLPQIFPVGCFADTPDRSLPILLKNFRNQINWYEMEKTVNQCAHVAHNSGYHYFAVQFYGECWSGVNASSTYNKYGESTSCWEGVGEDWANFVYKFT